MRGPWASGFALHVHTVSSTYLGEDEWGHARFATTRSPVGELLYRLKYRQDRSAVPELTEAASSFCRDVWRIRADGIVPVPPSQSRRVQPVLAVATALSEVLEAPLCKGLTKVKRTPQLKDLTEYDERVEALENAFDIVREETKGKRLLLMDDIYGSGATVRTIAQLLMRRGGARAVHLLTLTKKA